MSDPFETSAVRKGPSLKARAIALLSRREHSRVELRRKLSRHCENPAELDQVLVELERGGWLSEQRFAESVVHRRAPRHGVRRILNELRQHDLPENTLNEVAERLRATELERAREVWLRKFDTPPADAKEYARQFRYMAARGFSPDCLRRILSEQSAASRNEARQLFDPDELPPADEV